MRIPILFLCTLFLTFSCKQHTCELPAEIEAININLKAERLDQRLFESKSRADIARLLKENPLVANRFLDAGQYPSDTILTGSLYRLATEPNLRSLAKQADERFNDMASLENELSTAFKFLKHYYPETRVPKLATFITGMGQDLYVSDSLIVWGLEFFIGPKAKYRPQFPQYILQRYDKPFLVPSTVLLLSNKVNKANPADNTMLAEMLTHGKSLYFTERLLPCTADSLIIGYTNQQMADVAYNQAKIWGHFVEKGLLFDNDQFKIKKYVGERPNVPEIGKQCPGRIGAWVGWQIIRKYMQEKPEVTLQQLMAETNFQKILTDSKYKPQKS